MCLQNFPFDGLWRAYRDRMVEMRNGLTAVVSTAPMISVCLASLTKLCNTDAFPFLHDFSRIDSLFMNILQKKLMPRNWLCYNLRIGIFLPHLKCGAMCYWLIWRFLCNSFLSSSTPIVAQQMIGSWWLMTISRISLLPHATKRRTAFVAFLKTCPILDCILQDWSPNFLLNFLALHLFSTSIGVNVRLVTQNCPHIAESVLSHPLTFASYALVFKPLLHPIGGELVVI